MGNDMHYFIDSKYTCELHVYF